MDGWTRDLIAAGAVAAALYLGLIGALLAGGRRAEARAVAGFVGDCVVLFRRLAADERVPRRAKLLIVALIAYLACPIDLVPDFLPVVGQLDDALLVVLVLRGLLRSGGPELLREHWPGPAASLRVIVRAASPSR